MVEETSTYYSTYSSVVRCYRDEQWKSYNLESFSKVFNGELQEITSVYTSACRHFEPEA